MLRLPTQFLAGQARIGHQSSWIAITAGTVHHGNLASSDLPSYINDLLNRETVTVT